jgi:hypothetical protein
MTVGSTIRHVIPTLTSLLATDQVQLLFRNALQILDIVKATFPNEVYQDNLGSINCDEVDSSGAELACLWRNLDEILTPSDGNRGSLHKDAVPSLLKASRSPEIWTLDNVTLCVLCFFSTVLAMVRPISES